MKMSSRRTRVVSFRLSEDEYKDLMNLCVTRGSRSLSDVARLATFSQLENITANGSSESSMQQIFSKLTALDREVQRLSKLMDPGENEAPAAESVEASASAAS